MRLKCKIFLYANEIRQESIFIYLELQGEGDVGVEDDWVRVEQKTWRWLLGQVS